jgi:hypothetical protein
VSAPLSSHSAEKTDNTQNNNTMFSHIRKIALGLGLITLCIAPAVAGSFHLDTTAGPTSGTAIVLSAGSAAQDCLALNPGSFASVSGPLGTFSQTGPASQGIFRSGPVAPGSYSCSVYASGGGFAMITINW